MEDYGDLIDIAKINLSNCINETLKLYKKQKDKETKTKLITLICDRQRLFLFDKEIIKKYAE